MLRTNPVFETIERRRTRRHISPLTYLTINLVSLRPAVLAAALTRQEVRISRAAPARQRRLELFPPAPSRQRPYQPEERVQYPIIGRALQYPQGNQGNSRHQGDYRSRAFMPTARKGCEQAALDLQDESHPQICNCGVYSVPESRKGLRFKSLEGKQAASRVLLALAARWSVKPRERRRTRGNDP